MKLLQRIEFGDPVLRQIACRLTLKDITSNKVQSLIKNMRHTLISKKLGIGLAAPQVAEGVAVSVIAIRPTKHRPQVKSFDLVIINPEIIHYLGKQKAMWEGCLSAGPDGLFARVPRFNKVEVKYLDEKGHSRQMRYEGLRAQVIQHEIDHLNGVLFVDHVQDTRSYMTLKEYKKRIIAKRSKSEDAMIKL